MRQTKETLETQTSPRWAHLTQAVEQMQPRNFAVSCRPSESCSLRQRDRVAANCYYSEAMFRCEDIAEC